MPRKPPPPYAYEVNWVILQTYAREIQAQTSTLLNALRGQLRARTRKPKR